MIKVLFVILGVIGATAAISKLLDLTGFAVISLGNSQLEVPTNALLFMAGVVLLFCFFGGALFNWLIGLPSRIKRRVRAAIPRMRRFSRPR
ncbi:MAG: hypothetical protein AAF788_03570, partial [Pseudomonadota bacterium]